MSLSSTTVTGGGAICATSQTMFLKHLIGMRQHRRASTDGNGRNSTMPLSSLLHLKSTWSDLPNLLYTCSYSMSASSLCHVVFLLPAPEPSWTASTEYQTQTEGH